MQIQLSTVFDCLFYQLTQHVSVWNPNFIFHLILCLLCWSATMSQKLNWSTGFVAGQPANQCPLIPRAQGWNMF